VPACLRACACMLAFANEIF